MDHTIDSIRQFDIETQLTIEPIESCRVIPVDLFSKTRKEIEFFKMSFRNSNEGNHMEWPLYQSCLLYTSPSPRDRTRSRMPSSA